MGVAAVAFVYDLTRRRFGRAGRACQRAAPRRLRPDSCTGRMPPAPRTRPAPSARARHASLNLVLAVGIIDALLLLVLLYVAFVDRSDGAVSVIGPTHGLGYVYLLYLTGTGAMRGMWGWWFPGLVLITGGPLGTLLGELRLRRET
jgi:hypothetical protein